MLASGVRAMKIWPFDPIAKETHGQYITPDLMERGLDPIRKIRERVGNRDGCCDGVPRVLESPSAISIARALEPYAPMWLEEMLPQDNLAAYRQLAASTHLPLCVSERLMTRWGFRELFANQAARFIMPDLCWCGGFSEARKIAAIAEMHYLPIAPHNCGGPVLHFASAHLAANATNLYVLETVRQHYLDEYNGLLTKSLLPQDGQLPIPNGPGLGVELNPEILGHEKATIQRTPR